MTKIVAGNWKMNGTPQLAADLSKSAIASAEAAKGAVSVILCPPATLISQVSSLLASSPVGLSGQDCHFEEKGAFTGDISPLMLKESGCGYVLVGHSERRQYHGETSELVARKAASALKAGLTPIICVGETLEERESGRAEQVVEQQLKTSVPEGVDNAQFLLAYEPVWAIGTGQIASVQDIASMHGHIERCLGGDVRILYGGSVKPRGAEEIMSTPGVSGVLVGGASLVAADFSAIIEAAARADASAAGSNNERTKRA